MNTRSTTVVLDSSQRDAVYLLNNKWQYNLQNVYEKVKKIKLIGAIIGNSEYIINTNNKVITVTYSGTSYNFTLTEGNYTPTALATELQTRLNTNSFGGVFTISANSSTNKFRFQCTVAVVYNFSSNTSLGRIFGFGAIDTSAVTDVTSTNAYQVNSTRYYKVIIREIGVDYDTNLKGQYFTFLIPNNVNSGEFNYVTPNNNINNVIERPQEQNIARFNLQVYNEDGYLVLLNGVDYLLMIELEYCI
jgi:hypothetical protein